MIKVDQKHYCITPSITLGLSPTTGVTQLESIAVISALVFADMLVSAFTAAAVSVAQFDELTELGTFYKGELQAYTEPLF